MAVLATPSSGVNKGEPSFSHAVSRSVELLSCAKTALKIGKAQHANDDDHGGSMWWACQEPNYLALCAWKDQGANSELDGLCEDGLALLRTMDVELTQLESLVRRRGHTNDPTEEIAASVRRLETDAKELSSLVKTGFVFPRASSQYQRHSQLIATWLESVANQQMAKLKEILKVRGNVLADQAQRRKLLNPQGPGNNTNNNHAEKSGSSSMSATAMSRMEPKKVAPKAINTPLFTMSPPPKPLGYANTNNQNNGNATAPFTSPDPTTANGYNNSNSATSSYYAQTPAATTTPAYAKTNPYGGGPSTTGGYGGGGYGGYGGGGGAAATGSYYGGGAGGPATTGMRQRRAKATNNYNYYDGNNNNGDGNQQEDEAAQIQMRMQKRQQQRQTENRLQEAHEAEHKLAELGTMFSKMTSLITQQGEVLEKVEDDMEAGLSEVTAGQQEITTLYSLKKGNRGLIIKLFSLLIFLIIFMRFYKN